MNVKNRNWTTRWSIADCDFNISSVGPIQHMLKFTRRVHFFNFVYFLEINTNVCWTLLCVCVLFPHYVLRIDLMSHILRFRSHPSILSFSSSTSPNIVCTFVSLLWKQQLRRAWFSPQHLHKLSWCYHSVDMNQRTIKCHLNIRKMSRIY